MFQVYKVWFWRESSWSMTMKYTFKLSQWRNLLAKGSVSFNSEFFFSNMEEMDGRRWKKVFRKFLRSTVPRKLEKSNKTSQDRDLKINNQSTIKRLYIFKTENSKYCLFAYLNFKLRNPSKKKKETVIRKIFQNILHSIPSSYESAKSNPRRY